MGKTLALLFAIELGRSTAFTASPVLQTQQQCPTALLGGDMGYDAGGSYDDGSYDGGSGYQNNDDLLLIRDFLQQYYSGFYSILDMNEEVWKAIGETKDGNEVGFTVFAPTNEALQSLGADKEAQLFDERNTETAQKIAAYHVIGEPVTAEALFNSGGVVTCGGEVPIERSISGGIFGIGGQEDGGVTLNGAKVLQTATVGNGIVHEVDTLLSPSILWRYMDQLRIPGST
uniref:FAS1 domain-containing protein n=1 Tax=Pseudo-nitzschia delicatissima TaxID=44447 RepID=A0A7S0Y8S8_9STRA